MKLIKLVILIVSGLGASAVMATDTVLCPGVVTCEQSKNAVWDKGFKEGCAEVVSVTKISNTRLEIECSVDSVKGWRYEQVVTAEEGYYINELARPKITAPASSSQ